MPPFNDPAFAFKIQDFGDDKLWVIQQAIGPENLYKLILNPEEWIEDFPLDPNLPPDQWKFPDVKIPPIFTICVHVATPGVPPDHMLLQGIGGTGLMNLYLPETITASSDLKLSCKSENPPCPDAASISGKFAAFFLLDLKPEEATGSKQLTGKLFLHYPIFTPMQTPDKHEAERRAFALAQFHLELAKKKNLTDVGRDKFLVTTDRTAMCRVGTKLVDYIYDSAKIPHSGEGVPANTQAVIFSEKNATREACEILVAKYLAGELTWEEAYTKPYAGP